MYQSSEVISVALTSYINTGGAHGVLTITFLNFDAETGFQISSACIIIKLLNCKIIKI